MRLALIALAMSLVPAMPALADERSDFTAACLGTAGGTPELCTCMTDMAFERLDERMRGYVKLSIADPDGFRARSGELSDADYAQWTQFIRDYGRACIPGY